MIDLRKVIIFSAILIWNTLQQGGGGRSGGGGGGGGRSFFWSRGGYYNRGQSMSPGAAWGIVGGVVGLLGLCCCCAFFSHIKKRKEVMTRYKNMHNSKASPSFNPQEFDRMSRSFENLWRAVISGMKKCVYVQQNS